RKWAYRAIRQGWPDYDVWLAACIERVDAYNLKFTSPLDRNEVLSIAKSIAKWTIDKFSPESFNEYVALTHGSKIQAKRGRLGGLKSKGGGRKVDPNSESQRKPWLLKGISRSSYYRQK
ncbi:primase C-terminal domain-containing protein, partial [Cronobacter malonaticus]